MPASEFVLRRDEIEADSSKPPRFCQHQPRDPEAGFGASVRRVVDTAMRLSDGAP